MAIPTNSRVTRNDSINTGAGQHGVGTVSEMQKKYGKFYADWTDEKGHRRRKAFKTKKAATAFTAKQRAVAAEKKAHRRKPSSPPSSKQPSN